MPVTQIAQKDTWVKFDSTGAVIAGNNVTSVTKNSTGDFTINFTSAFPDANYCVNGTAQQNVAGALQGAGVKVSSVAGAQAAASCRVITVASAGWDVVIDCANTFVRFIR